MKKIPIIVWGIVIIAVIVLSFINTKITDNITGKVVLSLGDEFPGIGVLFIILFGIAGMFLIIRLR